MKVAEEDMEVQEETVQKQCRSKKEAVEKCALILCLIKLICS